jgi:hypothetical protein
MRRYFVQRGDVDDVGTDSSGLDREIDFVSVQCEFCFFVCHGMSFHKCERPACAVALDDRHRLAI